MKILIPLAEGFEEIEAMTPIDVWRRAGFEVVTAAIQEGPTRAAHKTSHLADALLEKVIHETYDMIFLPGGNPGYINLGKCAPLIERLKKQADEDKWIAAICAAPTVLGKAGLLKNKNCTCYPSVRNEISQAKDARVVVDGKLITGIAAGAAMEFALEIVRILAGEKKLEAVKKELVCS
ncbi:MAG: DJ-1 family glyoxalase III [Verrucomicrobiota bacterium]